MTKASFAEEELMLMLREIGNEARKIFYPGEMVVPIEKVDCLRWVLELRDIERVATTPLVVEEGEDIDTDSKLLLDLWYIDRRNWIVEMIEVMLLEELVVVFCAV